ncbi:conserved Plasmodium protein, unknown function [Plasmodium relictum]|uniref:Uncharacterized protein n=1 Tax=Plasmodium relictum TaxID=85471 RepID=A0A1J1H9M0_PLARL|nr:conserved Plasmodium protein, unknown function [Plasmodium relictum]CRH01207.1 conserved Plasmodium protein, unknown function [Plasmodium relictum]
MRTQSEIIKPLTPLRRIPKNRGTVVRNVSDVNPLSEKEIKNVIEVYSEANKAYYKNHIKNEKNKNKNKKKKKKIISKKTKSEEFDSLCLNPLEYRNKKFEENGTLLHLPGSSVTPKYVSHNPNTEYGVSSLSYVTLHKSNPLSWGFDYKKHYELPTICSIVKSKHPIYSKPNDRKKKQKYPNLSKSKTKKKKDKTLEKNDENLIIKKVPTFGNYKEYEISDCSEGKNKSNEELNECIKNIENSIKGNDNLDTFNENLDISSHYPDSNEDSKNNLSNYKLVNGIKIIENNNDNCITPLKKEYNKIESKNKNTDNDYKKESIMHKISELNLVHSKNENSLNIYPTLSPDRILSNSTLMEFKFLNIGLNNSNNQHMNYNNCVLECSNDSRINNKSSCNNLNDTPSHKENYQDANYWNGEKHKNDIPNYSTTEDFKSKPKVRINPKLSKQKESYYEYSEEESDKNSKKSSSIKHKKYSRTKEKNYKSSINGSNRNNNDKKNKKKAKIFEMNNSLNNNLNKETNSSNEIFRNQNKNKYSKKYSMHSNDSRKGQSVSNNKRNYTSHNNINSKYNSQKNLSMNFSNTTHPRSKESQCANIKTSNNIIANNPLIQKSLEIQQSQIYKTENLPNEQSYMQKEVTYVHRNLPINQMKINSREEAHIPSIQVYTPLIQANMHEAQSITHNTQAQMLHEQQTHKLQNQLSPIQAELTHIQTHIPQCETKIYQPNSHLPHIQTNVAEQHIIPQVQLQIPHVKSQISQIQNQILQIPTVISKMQSPMYQIQNQIPINQTHTQIPPMQNPIQLQTQVPQSQPQIPEVQTKFPQSQIPTPQIQTQNLQIQNHTSQLHTQVPLMQKSIISDQVQLSQVHTNEELKSPNKLCNLVELSKRCLDLKNYNNAYSLCNIQNQGEYNIENCFVKSFNPNNTSYNRVISNVNNLENNLYMQNNSVNSLSECNKNTDSTKMNNIKGKCIEQIKTLDSTINFVRSENEIPWLKSYIDIQSPTIKNRISNMNYLSVDFNDGKQNVNCNTYNSDEILANHQNFQLFNNNTYKPNNSQLELNKNGINQIDVSHIIKASNENLINLQNKQLLNILHEESNGKSNATKNIIYHGNDNLNVQRQSNINENSQNFLDNTNKHVSCMNYINVKDFSENFLNKTNNIIIPSIPNEIINKNQLVQNNIKKTDYLN